MVGGTGVEGGNEIRKLHVMCCGITSLKEVKKVLEEMDLAGNP